jgi:hypothetical protein
MSFYLDKSQKTASQQSLTQGNSMVCGFFYILKEKKVKKLLKSCFFSKKFVKSPENPQKKHCQPQ